MLFSDSLSLRFSFETAPTRRVANSFDVIARIWAPELPFRFLRAKETSKALSVSALAEKLESSEIVLKTAATFLASSARRGPRLNEGELGSEGSGYARYSFIVLVFVDCPKRPQRLNTGSSDTVSSACKALAQ